MVTEPCVIPVESMTSGSVAVPPYINDSVGENQYKGGINSKVSVKFLHKCSAMSGSTKVTHGELTPALW